MLLHIKQAEKHNMIDVCSSNEIPEWVLDYTNSAHDIVRKIDDQSWQVFNCHDWPTGMYYPGRTVQNQTREKMQ